MNYALGLSTSQPTQTKRTGTEAGSRGGTGLAHQNTRTLRAEDAFADTRSALPSVALSYRARSALASVALSYRTRSAPTARLEGEMCINDLFISIMTRRLCYSSADSHFI